MNARWLSLFPMRLRTRLEGRLVFQKILENSGWLLADKVVRVGVALFVYVWIARYLGPHSFGLLNYSMALVAFFSTFATMGLQGIVIRDLVRLPEKKKTLLASAFLLRLGGAVLGIGLASLVVVLLRPDDRLAWAVVVILAVALLPQAMDVIDYGCQSEAEVSPIIIIRANIFIIFSLLKVAIILGHGSVMMFALASSLEALIVGFAFLVYAKRNNKSFRLRDATLSECMRLMKESWPLIFAGVAVTVYMRIDQIMIGEILGDGAVGMFSAAVRVTEAWYMVPVSVMAAVTPALVVLHQQSALEYERKLVAVMRLLVWMAIVVAILLMLFAKPIVSILYGSAYLEAGNVLVIYGWAGVLVSFGLVSGSWLTNAGLLKFSLYQTLAGAVANAGMNVLLIPKYGITGAAVATIVGQSISAVIFNLVSPRTRRLARLQLRSLTSI